MNRSASSLSAAAFASAARAAFSQLVQPSYPCPCRWRQLVVLEVQPCSVRHCLDAVPAAVHAAQCRTIQHVAVDMFSPDGRQLSPLVAPCPRSASNLMWSEPLGSQISESLGQSWYNMFLISVQMTTYQNPNLGASR